MASKMIKRSRIHIQKERTGEYSVLVELTDYENANPNHEGLSAAVSSYDKEIARETALAILKEEGLDEYYYLRQDENMC